MVSTAKMDVSKVSSEPHKYKSPALRNVSCPTSQKIGRERDSERVTGAVHQEKKWVCPWWAIPHPPTHSEVPE